MKNLHVMVVLAALVIGTLGDRPARTSAPPVPVAGTHPVLDAQIGPVRIALTLNG